MATMALAVSPAYADPADDLARLKQEATRLRQSLEELDARIRALEGEDTASAAARDISARPSAPSYLELQRTWSELKLGVSKERVDTLLGKPEREMRVNGDLVWYYVYPGFGRGSVFFNSAGVVAAVQSPRIGWFW